MIAGPSRKTPVAESLKISLKLRAVGGPSTHPPRPSRTKRSCLRTTDTHKTLTLIITRHIFRAQPLTRPLVEGSLLRQTTRITCFSPRSCHRRAAQTIGPPWHRQHIRQTSSTILPQLIEGSRWMTRIRCKKTKMISR